MTAKNNQPVKKSKDALWTLIGLFAISAIMAAYVINFRVKMKKYQITPEEAKEVIKQEKEFNEQQKAAIKPRQKPLEQ